MADASKRVPLTAADSAWLRMEDPTNLMTTCVTGHPRLTLATVQTHAAAQVALYDVYDTTNDSEAIDFLFDSLMDGLAKELRSICDEADTFAAVWMRLIKIVSTTNIERFNHLKHTIKHRHPTQFPGQDLTQMAADYRTAAKKLTTAGQYDHNLTLNMLNSFLDAGGKDNEDYHFELRSLKTKLKKALVKIAFLERTAADKLIQTDPD